MYLPLQGLPLGSSGLFSVPDSFITLMSIQPLWKQVLHVKETRCNIKSLERLRSELSWYVVLVMAMKFVLMTPSIVHTAHVLLLNH